MNNNGIMFQMQFYLSNNLIRLFQNNEYEKYVFEIMNSSPRVFPERYIKVESQAHSECDFIAEETRLKFDAKLPFTKEQVELLTSGKKHKPEIIEWLKTLDAEAREFNQDALRSKTFDVTKTKLYTIMRDKIVKDNLDENIVFFFPFQVVPSIRGTIIHQFSMDYLHAINDSLCTDVDLSRRRIYAIYPTYECNIFAARDIQAYITDYINCEGLGNYFSYGITGFEVN